jgi:hypothetical protein
LGYPHGVEQHQLIICREKIDGGLFVRRRNGSFFSKSLAGASRVYMQSVAIDIDRPVRLFTLPRFYRIFFGS